MIARLAILVLLTGCGPATEVCSNGLDDDGNGLADCADEACFSSSCLEICDDGLDNNANELLDCADPQCDGKQACGEQCDDGRDNDRNGAIDCQDEACLADCDADSDGYLDGQRGGDDCIDDDPAINPGATEICNGIDDNCNSLVDRADPDIDPNEVTLWHADEDGDGYGSMIDALYECDQPPGRVTNGEDCDDDDETVNPDTPEVCNGVDDNCDGLVDDEDPAVDLSGAPEYWPDADGDGLGDASMGTVAACRQPAGYADNDLDCDDTDDTVLEATIWLADVDGDGFGDPGAPVGLPSCLPPGPDYAPSYLPSDCDDGDPVINPDAMETCGDGIDSNCDGNDCSEWIEDFESGSLSNDWTTGGNANWFVQGTTVRNGMEAAESGNIADSQNTWMQVTIDYQVDGTLTFWHSGDTEAQYDFLRFYVDGTQVMSRSGLWSWTQQSVNVTAGVHTFEWRYAKDFTLSAGLDTVWVDDIEAVGGSPL